MNDLKYNASHAADPVAAEAIRKADKKNMPPHIKGFIDSMKRTAKDAGLSIENRIAIKDLETGRIWP